MSEVLQRELIYLWYYADVQLRQIAGYWIFGMILGSVVSVFLKERIHRAVRVMDERTPALWGWIAAAGLGIVSPLCMYGTIPVAASFARGGVRDDRIAAFMMSSMLLNPQLIFFSAALGTILLAVRVAAGWSCGVIAGILVFTFYRKRPFFAFDGFDEPVSRDVDANLLRRFAKNLLRNVRVTAPYFLIGIALSALFQRYIPADWVTKTIGGNEAWGVLLSATIGVPLYACGGGTIPLLQQWLWDGMSLGSAAAFMITGPATKITNLGALKIVMTPRRFGLYLGFVLAFSWLIGVGVNLIFG